MENRPVPSSQLVFWLALLYLPAIHADQTIYIQLHPRYNATPVSPPDPACPTNPDQRIQILLTPAITANRTAAPNNFGLCGVDETVDPERLLSEWNGPYVFDFLNSKDTSPTYRTNIFNVLTFTNSGEVDITTTSTTTTTTTTATTTTTITTTTTTTTTTKITTTTTNTTTTNTATISKRTTATTSSASTGNPINETHNTTSTTPAPTTTMIDTRKLKDDIQHGLFSLFIAPPTSKCNGASLEAAANGESGFYPVFIGLSSNFSAQKEIFLVDSVCLQSEFGGRKPRLCGTKLLLGEVSGKSRLETLAGIFNFPYNHDRKVRPNTLKQCNTSASTKESITKCSYFDTTSPIWFKTENTTAFEDDGFAKIQIHRNNNMAQKTVGHVKTEISQAKNAASEADFVQYEGPVVFEKEASITEVVIDLKKDDIEEPEEMFILSVDTTVKSRRKRMFGWRENRIIVADPAYQRIQAIANIKRQKKADISNQYKAETCWGGDLENNNIPLYALPLLPANNDDDPRRWDRRCNVQTTAEGVSVINNQNRLPVFGNYNHPGSRSSKAAMEILEAIWKNSHPWDTQCQGMNRFTVAIARVRNQNEQWIAVAANVDFRPDIGLGSSPPPEWFTDKIMTILLKYELLPDASTRIVILKNPFDQPEHMQRHAEMQLTRYARDNGLKIEFIGVSKTPCCMCNTVLNTHNLHVHIQDEIIRQTDRVPDYDERARYLATYHDRPNGVLSDLEGVYSGPGSTKCDGEWCGSQFGADAGEFDKNIGSWRHPEDHSFAYDPQYTEHRTPWSLQPNEDEIESKLREEEENENLIADRTVYPPLGSAPSSKPNPRWNRRGPGGPP